MTRFANKGKGYYINAVASLCALVLAVFVLATQTQAMPNGANGMPIAISLLAGFVVQVILTFVPLRFASIILVAVYTASAGIVINTIINVFADVINNVKYAGGNFVICMIYLIATIAIALACVVASFFDQKKTQ